MQAVLGGGFISLHAFTPHCLSCSQGEFIGYCCWGLFHRGDQPPRPMFCLDPRQHPITVKKIRLSLVQNHRLCELQDGISLLGSIFLPLADAPGSCLVFLPKIVYLLPKSSSSVLFIETLSSCESQPHTLRLTLAGDSAYTGTH